MNDPLPRIIADQITGLIRDGDDGPFWKLDAKSTGDGREIIIEATSFFNPLGDRTVRVVLHLSPPMPVDVEPTPCPASKNGSVVDPVIATPDGSTG